MVSGPRHSGVTSALVESLARRASGQSFLGALAFLPAEFRRGF